MRISDWSSDVCASDLDVDGLNRYTFVGNNPLRYLDTDGQAKAESVIMLYSNFLSELSGHSSQLLGQLHNIIQQKSPVRSLMGTLVGEVAPGVFGYEGGDRKWVVEGKGVSDRVY